MSDRKVTAMYFDYNVTHRIVAEEAEVSLGETVYLEATFWERSHRFYLPTEKEDGATALLAIEHQGKLYEIKGEIRENKVTVTLTPNFIQLGSVLDCWFVWKVGDKVSPRFPLKLRVKYNPTGVEPPPEKPPAPVERFVTVADQETGKVSPPVIEARLEGIEKTAKGASGDAGNALEESGKAWALAETAAEAAGQAQTAAGLAQDTADNAMTEAQAALNLAKTKADAPVTRLHNTDDPSSEVYAEIAPGGGGHEVRVATNPVQEDDGWYLTVDGVKMLVEGMPEQPLTALIGNTFTTRPAGFTVSFAWGSPPLIVGTVSDASGTLVADVVISAATGGVTVYPEPGRDVAFGYNHNMPLPSRMDVYPLLTQARIDGLATKADIPPPFVGVEEMRNVTNLDAADVYTYPVVGGGLRPLVYGTHNASTVGILLRWVYGDVKRLRLWLHQFSVHPPWEGIVNAQRKVYWATFEQLSVWRVQNVGLNSNQITLNQIIAAAESLGQSGAATLEPPVTLASGFGYTAMRMPELTGIGAGTKYAIVIPTEPGVTVTASHNIEVLGN